MVMIFIRSQILSVGKVMITEIIGGLVEVVRISKENIYMMPLGIIQHSIVTLKEGMS